MMVCHVCLNDVGVDDMGLVVEHAGLDGACWMSGAEPFTWDEAATRPAVKGRSGGVCESCQQQQATDMHHRISAGAGGWWSPAQIIHLCRPCHSWVTDHPKEAYEKGLSVRSTDNPADIPVLQQTGALLFLSDDILPPVNYGKRQ